MERKSEYLSTGVANLDLLLGGGLLRRESQDGGSHVFPSVLIMGDSGCGKTTLATTLACQSIRRGCTAAYFSIEERPFDIAKLAQAMSLSFDLPNKGSHPRLVIDNDTREPLEDVLSHQKVGRDENYLLISFCPPVNHRGEVAGAISMQQLRNRLLEMTPKRDSKRTAPEIIVVDSLLDQYFLEPFALRSRYAWRASENQDPSSITERSIFNGLCKLGNDIGAAMILVAEKSEVADWRKFVADIVIDVSWTAQHTRSIRILKARYQPSLIGEHELSISRERGPEVFVSPGTFANKVSIGTSDRQSGMVDFSCDENINSFVGEKISEGSSTLVFGVDETRKNAVAVRFLQQAMIESPNSHPLFVICGSTKESARNILRTYWLTSRLGEAHRDHVKIIESPPSVEAISRFMNDISLQLNTLSSTSPRGRAIVIDANAIDRIAHGTKLSEVLRNSFLAAGVTSLFVRTTSGDRDTVDRESYDNVIRARYLSTGERHIIGFRMPKLNGATQKSLRTWVLNGYVSEMPLRLDDCLSQYEESPEGAINPTRCSFRLYHPYESQKGFWHDFFTGMLGEKSVERERVIVDPFTRYDADFVHRFFRELQATTPIRDSIVVNFDDHWGESFAREEKLMPLADVFSESKALDRMEQFFAQSIWESSPIDRHGNVIGIPHHIDFGFYTVNIELLKKIDIAEDFFDEGWCWKDLIDLQETCTEKGVAVLNPYSNGIVESLICFFLEAVWPVLFAENNVGSDASSPLCWTNPKLLKAIKELHKLFQAGKLLPLHEANATAVANSGSIVQRNWAVSFWNDQGKREPTSQPKFRAIPAPSLCLEGEIVHCASMRGNWYLGILNGGPPTARAAMFLRNLISEESSLQLANHKIGIPARVGCMTHALAVIPSEREIEERHRKSVSRRSIPGYSSLRPLIIQLIRESFCDTKFPDERVDHCLTQLDLCDRQ